jgi:Group 4 capsule polysaccharide lipoprotein gfcB, YjbF
MRRIAAVFVALVVAGCTNEGLNPIVEEGYRGVSQRVLGGTPATDRAEPPRALTRSDIEASGRAAVRARLLSDDRGTLLYGVVENNGVVTYASALRQTLGFRGGMLVSTRGLGYDLLSATSSQPDPVVRPTPPQSWPSEVVRTYQFPANAPQGRIEQYSCTFEYGDVRTITILTKPQRGVEISETCTGEAGSSFENLYFADLRTGFIWRSIQWTGPKQGLIDIEVIEPLTE